MRPHWVWSLGLHALLGTVASVVAVYEPAIGLAAAAVLALSLAIETWGRGHLLGLVTLRRATQSVVSPPRRDPQDGEVLLLIAAPYSAPRQGIAVGERARRLGARAQRLLRHRAPGARAWPVLALLAVAATAGARLAGAEGTAIGAVQLVPTVGLLLTLALAVDIGLSPFARGSGEAAAAAAAIALADALDRRPPQRLAVAVILHGAADGGGAPAMRAYLNRIKHRPQDTAVLEILACAGGEPRWIARHGALLATRSHPQLVAAARQAEQSGRPHVLHRTLGATTARARRLPAIAVGTFDPTVPVAGEVDRDTIRAAGLAALAIVRELDRGLQAGLEKRADSSPTRGRESVSS